MKVAVVKLIDKAWQKHVDKLQKKANRLNRQIEIVPAEVFFLGTRYFFNPYCEVSEYIGRIMARRSEIEFVELKEVSNALATDEKDEADRKYGEVHLCKHCGWPYATPQGRDMHENRWCKRKGE